MILLVTGAAGFLGRALVRAAALAPEAEISGIVALGPSPPAAALPARALWETGSASDPDRVARLLDAHAVTHVAHLARTSRNGEGAALMRAHVGGTLALLCAVARARRPVEKVLIAGSAAEYGLVSESELPLDENHPPLPTTAYGHAKAAESALALLAPSRLGVPALVARIFNPVGPGQSPSFVCAALVKQFLDMQRSGGAPTPLRVGALTPVRDFIDVADVAGAMLALLRRGTPGEAYNVRTGRATSIAKVVEILSGLTGIRPALPPPPPGAAEAREHSVASARKLEAATGFVCRTPLRESLRAMLEAAAASGAPP